MPTSDIPEVIVARFLKSNGYYETLAAFLKEACLPPGAEATNAGDWTIENILEDKRQFEASVVYEKVSEKDAYQGWSLSAPSKPHIVSSLSSPSNILAVHVTPSGTPWTTHQGDAKPSQLLVSSADRKISVLSTDAQHELQKTLDLTSTHNSPVLSIASIGEDAFMTSSMSGNVDLYESQGRLVDSRRHHAKYAVQVIITRSQCDTPRGKPFYLAASAGWDQKICIYSFDASWDTSISDDGDPHSDSQIGSPVATISTLTNPESVLFVRHPTSDDLYLIVGRRDSTYLYYYRVTEKLNAGPAPHPIITLQEAGRQNLAPHANAWISFSPSSIAACPIDTTLVAVATSHLPHMKIILIRLLFPDLQGEGGVAASVAGRTQTSQARAELAVQDREDEAILLHVSTMAPQTPYSTPQVVWRPDGSGVWVNGDDGVIRGLEVKTGKVVAVLRGHEDGSKVRTLWAGMVGPQAAGGENSVEEEEWLMSGGFDKNVIVWRAENRSVNM